MTDCSILFFFFIQAIGYLIPLMDAEYANYYTREVMLILIREFQSPDEEMKKIVLKVVKQCCSTDGVEAQYIKDDILPHFFKHFWNHRMALDRRNYRQLVDTTVEIANRVGASEIINRLVDDLKDENEQYRKMVMESIEKIMGGLGAADVDSRLEEQLIDGILYAFQVPKPVYSFLLFFVDTRTNIRRGMWIAIGPLAQCALRTQAPVADKIFFQKQ